MNGWSRTLTGPAAASGRKALLVLAAAVVATAAMPADRVDAKTSGGRTVTKQYVTGDGGPWMSTAVCHPDSDSYHVGAVCLGSVARGHVTLTIEDDSGLAVGGHVAITDGRGSTLYRQRFCRTSGPIALRPGVLFVHLDGPDALPGCPVAEFGYATKGRVHATFTR